ncbi:MAG TPA: NUDIX domain-containing protein [Patescibacteria group bacterium]
MQLPTETPTDNYFRGDPEHPSHLSVGAVLLSGDKICCHHFQFADFYILMRETVEPNETFEQALTRGLLDEFGARAKVRAYVGSLKTYYELDDKTVEKTTLYFLCELESRSEAWRKYDDHEKDSTIECHPISFLIPKMKEQAQRLNRTHLDESYILERAQAFLPKDHSHQVV